MDLHHLKTLLVDGDGVTNRTELATSAIQPDLVFESIAEVAAALDPR